MTDEREEAIGELVAEWMSRARADLVLAKLTDDERIAPEILAFHAQQAVEKALKALLVQRQIEFPHTHVIGVLISLCQGAGIEISETLSEAVSLTRFAVATRYPGDAEPVSRVEAQQAASQAGSVVDWIEEQIKS